MSKISTWAGGRVTNFGPRRREDNDPARGGAEGGIIVLPTPRAEICLPPDSPCRKQIPDWLAPIFSIKKRKKIWRTPFRPDASGVYSSPARCIGHVFVTRPANQNKPAISRKFFTFFIKKFVKSELAKFPPDAFEMCMENPARKFN